MRMMGSCLLMAMGVIVGSAPFGLSAEKKQAEKKVDARVFELRTYHAAPGKMKALHARFRDHTCKLFQKHGMEIIGFWSPTKPEKAEEIMVYLLAYPSKAAADKAWKSFR